MEPTVTAEIGVPTPLVQGLEPRPTSTNVSSALTRLDAVGALPLAAHPEVYQGVHADLERALAEIDGG